MKRNVYLILITVITILCIIAGTGYHLVRFWSLRGRRTAVLQRIYRGHL